MMLPDTHERLRNLYIEYIVYREGVPDSQTNRERLVRERSMLAEVRNLDMT